MSSTYPHYQPASSLPSDYGVLSRYARQHEDFEDAAHREGAIAENEGYDSPVSSGAIPVPGRGRRSTFSGGLSGRMNMQRRVSKQRLDPLDAVVHGAAWGTSSPAVPTETDPLLLQVPRLSEEADGVVRARIMFWEELKVLLRYTAPVFGTHLLEYSLQVASIVSIGHLSTTALAAATLASMTASVTGFSIAQGLTSALDTLLPAAFTSGNPEFVGLWAQRMTVIIVATLIPIMVLWLNVEGILLGLGQEPEVAALAALYLKWSSIGLPAYGVNCVTRRYFQSQGLFDVPTKIIFIVAPLNAAMNVLLVWGPEPIHLGFIGAPIATGISYNLILALSFVYGIWYAPDNKAWTPISKRSFQSLGLVINLGLAGVGQIASEWWSWELVGLAASQLGPVALATQSVLLVSASTTYQAPYAIAVAASVRIGNLLGEQNALRARTASHVSCVLALFVGTIWSTMFLVFRFKWGSLFNNDPAVGEMVAKVLPLVAMFQIFDGIAGVTNGVLRSRGKQGTGALINLSAYYLFGIPLGIYLAFKAGHGLMGLWEGLTLALVYASVVGLLLVLQTDWHREVRKVQDRFEKDRAAVALDEP
ncbi:MATE efflux family protein [Auriculariales sp. MPI-PUGE-AT-0066]|nr:MATE efflux family protein [Auriculariales sp. MPI-PUGE-AT-0066]